MKYTELKINVEKDVLDLAEAALLGAGFDSLMIDDPEDVEDILANKALYKYDYINSDLSQNMARKPQITLYFEDNEEGKAEQAKAKSVLAEFGDKVEMIESLTDDNDWLYKWQEYFKPTKVTDRLVVKPTWEQYEPQTDPVSGELEKIIEIDPGMAFGTGTHETTSMCMKALEKAISGEYGTVGSQAARKVAEGGSGAAAEVSNGGSGAAAERSNGGSVAAAEENNGGSVAAAERSNGGSGAAAQVSNGGSVAAAERSNGGSVAAAQENNGGSGAAAEEINGGSGAAAEEINGGSGAAAEGNNGGRQDGAGLHDETDERRGSVGTRVLDVGCGSGILAIAAALLGAEEALGIEIDNDAVEVAKSNVRLNRLSDCIEIRYGDLTKGVDYTADIVVANLMADLVVMLTPDVANHLVPAGLYISSGILLEKEEMVSDAIKSAGFTILEVLRDGEWCAIIAQL